jgi:hypothetical protein
MGISCAVEGHPGMDDRETGDELEERELRLHGWNDYCAEAVDHSDLQFSEQRRCGDH